MRHPKRVIPREVRTRRPKRPDQAGAEHQALTWPESALRVKEVMTTPPVTIRQDATAGAAWKLMRDRKIRHLPVLDDGGRLVGIVTDRDLRQMVPEPAVQEQLGGIGRAFNVLRVAELMTWGVVTVQPETDVRHGARIMLGQKIGALPVVDRGRVVGMLSALDLLRALVRIMDEGVVSRPARWRAEA
jgi:CBS domain-containing protein